MKKYTKTNKRNKKEKQKNSNLMSRDHKRESKCKKEKF